VRELEHAIDRATLVCDGPWLELEPLCETRETVDSVPPAPDRLDDVQRQHILHTLRNTGFRISGPHGAAAVLGLHPNTLRYRMKKLGIDRPR
jgi:formate hydrogenlyase transcriptional activator